MMTNSNAPIHTYQTRFETTAEADGVLTSYARLLSRVVRSLFALVMARGNILTCKSSFLKRFGITARQFNACRVTVDGKIASIHQLN